MALKENLQAVREGLNTEEQFIEKFIKSERFIKKYKFYLIAIIIIAILYFAFSYLFDYIKEKNIAQSNELYSSLVLNPNDTQKLNELKDKNINLYAIFLNNQLASDQNNSAIIGQLNELIKAGKIDPLLNNILSLNLGEKSDLLKDFDKLLSAYDLLEKGEIKQANTLLDEIKEGGELEQIARNLKHYQGINQ